jgi:hypothetical protein
MPRYVIERRFDMVDDEEMQEIAKRSKLIGIEEFPDIEWEHSHVCHNGDGSFRSYCVYSAPNPERLREHADRFGGHVINDIFEIVGDVTPADVRL